MNEADDDAGTYLAWLRSDLNQELKKMTDEQVMAQAAQYNKRLRVGRDLEERGKTIIRANIVGYKICVNELTARQSKKLEHTTDLL
jgi:hypothetical protein